MKDLLAGLRADFVERKLWIVALALVAALLAVPFLLGHRGTDDGPLVGGTVPVPGANDSPVGNAVVTPDTDPPSAVRVGALRDPFAGAYSTPTTPSSSAAPAPSGSSSTAGTSSPAGAGFGTRSSSPSSGPSASGAGASTPSSSGTSGSAGATTRDTAPPTTTATTTTTTAPVPVAVPAAQRTLAVTLGVSPQAGARIDRRPGSLRLAPLPSATDPAVLFLGMLEHTPAAVFMLPDGATAHGEGRCVPRPGDCQALELPVGGESYVDVPAAAGTRELRLSVPAAKVTTWSRVEQATAARERVSKAGLALVRAAVDRHDPALSYYRFSKQTGLLVRHKQPPKG